MKKWIFLVLVMAACGDDEPSIDPCGELSCEPNQFCIEGSCVDFDETPDLGSVDTSADVADDMLAPDLDISCEPETFERDGVCLPCDETRGTIREQTIEIDGETRTYLLHVPNTVDCRIPAPLWVHFHGTAGEKPEEAYLLNETLAAADRTGAILIRPRSRSGTGTETGVYRWDQNPGDVERNMTFTRNLVDEISQRFNLSDTFRVASGFSSGSNMTAVFLTEPDSPFTRMAPLAGGLWARDPQTVTAESQVEFVLFSSGSRDYLYPPIARTTVALDRVGIASARLPSLSGHEFHRWEIEAIEGLLTNEATPESIDDFVVDVVNNGAVNYVAMSDGNVVRVEDGTPNVVVATATFGEVFTDGCVTGRGDILFSSLSGFVRVDPNVEGPFVLSPWPIAVHSTFGVPYQMGIACEGDDVFAVGYWGAASSDDNGDSWTSRSILASNFAAQISDVVWTGTEWLSFGYYNAHRGDADSMSQMAVPPTGWYNGAIVENGITTLLGNGGSMPVIEGALITPEVGPADDLYDGVTCNGVRYVAGRQGVYEQQVDGYEKIRDRFSSRLSCEGAELRVFGETPEGELISL